MSQYSIVEAAFGVFDHLLQNTSIDEVKQQIEYLELTYKDLSIGKPDYSNVATRAAYMYRYFSGNASLIYNLLNENKELQKLIEVPNWRVMAFGGGPATELIALLKFACESNISPKIHFYILDICKEWSDVLDEITRLAPDHIELKITLVKADLCKLDKDISKLLSGADLVTVCYCGSEMVECKNCGSECFRIIIENMRKEVPLLYVDNAGPRGRKGFEAACNAASLDFRYKPGQVIFFDAFEQARAAKKRSPELGYIRASGNVQYIVI